MLVYGLQCFEKKDIRVQINRVPRGADQDPLLDQPPEMEVAFPSRLSDEAV